MVDLKRKKNRIKQKGNSPTFAASAASDHHHHCHVDPNPNYLYHCGASGSYYNAASPMINDRRPPMIRSCSSMIPARSDHVIAFRCIDPQISMQRLDRPPSLKIEPADSASDCNSRGGILMSRRAMGPPPPHHGHPDTDTDADIGGSMPLTIFYGGSISVYNNLSAAQAQEILRTTDSIIWKGPNAIPGLPCHEAGAEFRQKERSSDAMIGHDVPKGHDVPRALPQARKASLTRFLERRRKAKFGSNPPYVKDRALAAHHPDKWENHQC